MSIYIIYVSIYIIYVNISTSIFSDIIYKTEGYNKEENDKDLRDKDPNDKDLYDKEPNYSGDSNNDPSNNDPGNNDPSNNDPGNNDPSNNDPSNNDPSNNDPSEKDTGFKVPENRDPGAKDSNSCANKPEPCDYDNGYKEEESFEIEEELSHIKKLMKSSNNAMILDEVLPSSKKHQNSHLAALRKDPHVIEFFEGKTPNISDLPELNKALVEAKRAKKEELAEAKSNVKDEYVNSISNKENSNLHESNKIFNKDYKYDLDYKYDFDYKLDKSLLDLIIEILRDIFS